MFSGHAARAGAVVEPAGGEQQDAEHQQRGHAVDLLDLRQVDDHQLTVTVDQAFGRVGRARIVGCLEDLNLDLVLADVLTFESVPAPGG